MHSNHLQGELLYTGKTKQVFSYDNPELIVIHYKDDALAYNGIKRAQITNKGVINNKISANIYQRLEALGFNTHFVKMLNDREQLCKRKVHLIQIEFIVRNIAAGSMAKRLGLKIGTQLKTPVYELCYKNDELGDPIINAHHAVALGLSTYEELDEVHEIVKRLNKELINIFNGIGVTLVDAKFEFGRTADGTLVLSDEISPDTTRLWDTATLESLDRDRFRKDLGKISEAYTEIFNRLTDN
ncbi:MAG: phosphoribosylaminoimidazolesuccinocarboxamide synthase [Prevotellaceae bacterium]|jgi:phosphoribosylaminoimidazole-succinocarboxamide synthase|nr:phosphoribosylaminoimidazolesuccinocarboxamide synthase [Prevotellaceae bacterium]